MRQREDDRLLHLGVAHAIVQRRQLLNGHAGLTRPEESLLPQLDVLLGVKGNAHQPLLIARSPLLREGKQNLFLQILIAESRVKSAQKLGILRRPILAKVENCLVAQILRLALPYGEVAKYLLRPRLVLLRYGEQRLLLDVLVTIAHEDFLEEPGRSRHLRKPEHRLLANLLIWIGPRDIHESVRGLRRPLL